MKQALQWWIRKENILKGQPTQLIKLHLFLTAGASQAGWGAHLHNMHASVLWSKKETQFCINILKLRAVRLVLKAFLTVAQDSCVMVRTDNTTTMFIVQKG